MNLNSFENNVKPRKRF